MTREPDRLPDRAPSASRPWVLMFAAVCLVAVNMRMTITGLGPLLEEIAADQGTTVAALGGLASVPLLVWAVVSPLAHGIAARIGIERAVGWSLVVLAAGTAWRSLPGGSLSLWLGTACIGAALAIGNVLMPALVRRDFGSRIPLVMGVYSALLSAFGAVGAGIVVPIAHFDAGDGELGWRVALLAAGAPVPLALIVWIVATRRAAGERARGGATAPTDDSPEFLRTSTGTLTTIVKGSTGRRIWRDPVAWAVAFYMGLQSLSFYTMSTWLAPIQTSHGRTPVEAGVDVMVYQLAGIFGSLFLPLMYRGPLRRWLAAIVPVAVGVSAVGIVLDIGPSLPWLVIAGYGVGASLGLSLMFMAIRAREQETASALSGMAQSVGYLIAATGPLLFGLLHEVAGGWGASLAMLLVFAAGQLIAGLVAGRDRFVFARAR